MRSAPAFCREHSMSLQPVPNALLSKLQSIINLTEAEQRSVLALPMRIREIGKGQDIAREGDRPSQCCVVLDGFTFRYRLVEDGQRQIFSFQVRGDMPDLQSLHLEVMDHNIATLSLSTLGFILHADVVDLGTEHPRLAAAMWRETLIEASIFREWMTGLGRRPARTTIAHFICEIIMRLAAVGLADVHGGGFPTSHSMIG